jgi:ABC-type multidrug transport system fused ATPase/permease subunit
VGRPTAHASFLRLLAFARPYAGIVAVALLFALLYAGARNLRAYLVKPLFDEVLVPQQAGGEPSPMERWLPSFGDPPRTAPEPGGTVAAEEASRERIRASLWRVTLAGLVVILIIPLAHFGKDYLVQHTLGRVLVDIQQSLCRKLLALPLRFHHGTSRGDTLSRIMNDVARAHFALDLLFADVFQAVLAIGVGLAILISISWQLTLVSLVTVPLVVGVITLFGQRIRRSAQRRQEKLSDVTQRLMQILAGIKVIQAFRAEEQESAAFARENRALFRRSMKVVKNRVLARSVVEGLNNSIGVGVLILGALLVLNGLWGLTPGDLAAFVTVMATTYRPTKALTKGWAQLMDSLPAAERFFELLDEPPGVVDAPDAMRLDGVRRGIRISKVSFSYGREPVLRDVTVDAPVGSVIAIVGHRDRRYRPAPHRSRLPPRSRRRRDPGALPLQRHDPRQHPVRATVGRRRGRGTSRAGGARRRVRKVPAGGLRHRGGRSRGAALGWPAAAHHDCPRDPEEPVDPDLRRSHERPGREERALRAGGDRIAALRKNRVRDRPPAVHDPARRSDRGPGERERERDRYP